MKNVTASNAGSHRFTAFYGFLDPDNSVTQELTEPRASIEAVISDVADRLEREEKICFVQIVDVANLKPVEHCQTTLAGLPAGCPRFAIGGAPVMLTCERPLLFQ